MITRLTGTIDKEEPGQLTVDVSGIGYGVSVPVDTWDNMKDETTATLFVHSYIREDRFELYGFTSKEERSLFAHLIGLPGIGPKMGLEICAVPSAMLERAVATEDIKLLTSIKGVGKKMAEKLLIELKNLSEKQPDVFRVDTAKTGESPKSDIDQDAIAALQTLGYDQVTILQTLASLPIEIETTEERVTAALRAM